VAPGAGDGYTITVSNPNGTAATLNSITDTLPAGFTYVSGSTTGITTANPAVSTQTLTWSGPFTVPASGNATLHFNVTVSTVAGAYLNNAGGDAGNVPVAPSGPTAQITVGTGGAPPPPTTTQASAFLVANSAACGQVTLTATGVTAALLHQFVVTPSAGGTPYIVNATADSSQRITATINLRSAFGGSGGGTFTAFVRMASNQVTISNTVTFAAAACAVATPTPAPSAPASPTPAPTPKPTPTAAPIAQLPSTTTGGETGLPTLALAAMSIALAVFAWRKRDSRT